MSTPKGCPTGCTKVCFYCDATLSPRHEHDHWPTAKRHGGVLRVPICLNCHDLKDRIALADWPNDLALRAFAESGPLGRLFIAKCTALFADYNHEATATSRSA